MNQAFISLRNGFRYFIQVENTQLLPHNLFRLNKKKV